MPRAGHPLPRLTVVGSCPSPSALGCTRILCTHTPRAVLQAEWFSFWLRLTFSRGRLQASGQRPTRLCFQARVGAPAGDQHRADAPPHSARLPRPPWTSGTRARRSGVLCGGRPDTPVQTCTGFRKASVAKPLPGSGSWAGRASRAAGGGARCREMGHGCPALPTRKGFCSETASLSLGHTWVNTAKKRIARR